MQGYIKPSLDYIEQNLKTEIKTAELANMTGYSVTHYYRLFNKATGLSVANYISKKRINHALFEILAGRKAIDAVLDYGFDTYAGFYKAFVKMYGCSPMKYLTYYKNLTTKELEEILMDYNLTEKQKERIIKYYGNSFYSKMLENFDLYLEKWKLVDFEFIEDFDGSYHHIKFFCKSEIYGDCVLKIYDDDEILIEYNALLEYNSCGERYVKALGYEPSDKMQGAILTERVFPGKSLINEPSLEKRLEIYSELFNGMHIETKKPEIYYSYTHWVNTLGMPDELTFSDREVELKDFENLKNLHPELYSHALKAKEIYLNLLSVYNKKRLLHGRLDSYNIKSCGNGKYKVANPVGVIGDPVFDAGAFIFWECFKWYEKSAEPETAEIIIDYLEKSLNIPNKILRQVFYITAVMSYWGNDKDKYPENTIKFAENVMNNAK